MYNLTDTPKVAMRTIIDCREDKNNNRFIHGYEDKMIIDLFKLIENIKALDIFDHL